MHAIVYGTLAGAAMYPVKVVLEPHVYSEGESLWSADTESTEESEEEDYDFADGVWDMSEPI